MAAVASPWPDAGARCGGVAASTGAGGLHAERNGPGDPFCTALPQRVCELLLVTEALWSVEEQSPEAPLSARPLSPPRAVPQQPAQVPAQRAPQVQQPEPEQSVPAVSREQFLRLRPLARVIEEEPADTSPVWGCMDRGKEGKAKPTKALAGTARKKAPSALAKTEKIPRGAYASGGSCVSFASDLTDVRSSSSDSDSDALAEAKAAASPSDAGEEAQQQEEEYDVVVGPTFNAVMPKSFEELYLDGPGRPIRSRSRVLCLSDIMLLSQDPQQAAIEAAVQSAIGSVAGAPGGTGAASGAAAATASNAGASAALMSTGAIAVGGSRRVLSFGSVLHLCGHLDHCRPCMFERKARRCKKSWLCDFCHFHGDRARSSKFSSNESTWSVGTQEDQRRVDSPGSP